MLFVEAQFKRFCSRIRHNKQPTSLLVTVSRPHGYYHVTIILIDVQTQCFSLLSNNVIIVKWKLTWKQVKVVLTKFADLYGFTVYGYLTVWVTH